MIELIGNKVFLDDNYEIREYDTEKGIVRALISNECTQSLIYIDSNKRSELAIDYFNYYNIPIDLNPSGTDYLMLGGGAISYPHYYLNKYKDKKMDIVEINFKCIEYAKKYFYLDELVNDTKGRLNIIIDDAINYIESIDKRYDYILIDLFNGKKPVSEIYILKNIKNLKRILKENGIIVVNYIVNNNEEYKNDLENLINLTKNYKIITNNNCFDKINVIGNIIVVLSDNEIDISNSYNYIDVNSLLF